eukprot:TRINITY_DN8142_c0_g2_i1.p1 TRINITY_DN8142_c0_g2~~TRINITY_DN8142_c0_g2_i1.p1  ORF type:complete len:302 (+),score=101.28 TRINITY_DN8142_c0_g2_i1:172-1077(+)
MSSHARQEWMFEKAPAPYVVRAAEKDEYYKRYLVDDVEEVATRLFGTRWVNKLEQEIQLVGQSAYFLLASGGGRQTLGEEYCDLLAVRSRTMQPVTQARRLIQILLHLLVPYLMNKYLPHVISRFAPRSRQSSLQLQVKRLIQELYRFHLALFFINSTFYLVSSRQTDMGLLLMNVPSPDIGSYGWFGWSILIQQGLQAAQVAKRALWRDAPAGDVEGEEEEEDEEDQEDEGDEAVQDTARCGICLGKRGKRNGVTTATKCGHMFCWYCVTGLCTSSPSPLCPLCRDRITLATLAPVYTYQ